MDRRGLSGAELSRRTALSAPAILSYINLGEEGRVPALSAARRIATALRVPLDYLWPETREEAAAYSARRLAPVVDQMEELERRLERPTINQEQATRLLSTLEGLRQGLQLDYGPYLSPVEVVQAGTGKRVELMTLQVPEWVRQPMGVQDNEGTIWLVDVGNDRGPKHAVLEGYSVRVSSTPEGATGTLFGQLHWYTHEEQ